MKFKAGQTVKYNGQEVTILEKIKGGKTKKVNMHGGIMPTGYVSRPCTYLLSNGAKVRGSKLQKL